MKYRQEIIARIGHTPPLPMLVETLMAAGFAAPKNQPPDQTAILAAGEADAGLALDLLELLNQPSLLSCAGKSPKTDAKPSANIRTIPDALRLCGAKRLACLAVCVALAPRLKRELKGYGMPEGKLLEHSIVAGLAAQEIARVKSLPIPEHTFCSGFLGDVGKTCLDAALESNAASVLELADSELITFDQAEDLMLGINHAEAGCLLCEHWGLPLAIVEIVRWRLRPDGFPGHDPALDLVHMGEALAKLTGLGLGNDGMYYQPSTFVAQRLRLTPKLVDKAMAAAVAQAPNLYDLFLRFGD